MTALRLGADPRVARAGCVLLHGRGGSPEDVAALAGAWDGVAVILPRAPRGSWYDARAVDPVTDVTAAQLAASLALVDEAVADARGLPLLLAGFSQGACLAIEWALSRGPWEGGLAALTGCRVGTRWAAGPSLAGLPAYVSGSDADPWIPAEAFGAAVGALAGAGARVVAESFPGRPHAVSAPERARLDAMATALAAGRPAL